MIRATITYLDGPSISEDVLFEREIKLPKVNNMQEALAYTKAVINYREAPPKTTQINIVIWREN